MSQSVVEQIMGKLLLDRAFRTAVAADVDAALSGFELTEAERLGFKNLDLDDFHDTVSGLDERVSKGISMN